jgi:hypothetical protein
MAIQLTMAIWAHGAALPTPGRPAPTNPPTMPELPADKVVDQGALDGGGAVPDAQQHGHLCGLLRAHAQRLLAGWQQPKLVAVLDDAHDGRRTIVDDGPAQWWQQVSIHGHLHVL